MEEELAKILTNAELDETGKQEAIKSLVSKEYVPAKVHSEKLKEVKSTLETTKAEYETFKQSKMTDEEKQKEEIQARIEKEKNTNMLLSRMVAENTFSKAGFKEEDYRELLDTVVQEDYEKTQAFADKLCKTMITQKQTIEQKLKEQITKGTPTPEGGENGAIKTNIEKYQALYEQASINNNFSDMAHYKRLIFIEQNKK